MLDSRIYVFPRWSGRSTLPDLAGDLLDLESYIHHMSIERVIERIRESAFDEPQMIYIYRHGSCYRLFLILREIFPDCRAYTNENHVMILENGDMYDIEGKHKALHLSDGSIRVEGPMGGIYTEVKSHSYWGQTGFKHSAIPRERPF